VIASLRASLFLSLAFGLCASAPAGERSVTAAQDAAGASDANPKRHRVECFELRDTADGPPLGFASLHRTDSPEGTLLEWQISFPADGLNIFHAESCDQLGRRWGWRESRPRHSRSVTAEDKGTSVGVTEWGRPSVFRTALPTGDASTFPLELEERLRLGELNGGCFSLFDPMANSIESVRLELSTSPPEPVGDLRRADLIRDDGSLAGSWTFRGAELVSFAWQRGGLIAVRVDPENFAPHVARASLENAPSAPAASSR
jgi:hypothetical protein